MILRALGRLILVPLGFLLAGAATFTVLTSLGLERITHAMSGRTIDNGAIELFFELARGFVGLAGAATGLPALAFVIVGEVAGIRSALYYVAAGGIALAILPVLAASGTLGSGGITGLGTVWPIFATAGFAGGFVYWLVAGRSA